MILLSVPSNSAVSYKAWGQEKTRIRKGLGPEKGVPHIHSRPTHKEQTPPLAQTTLQHCLYLLIMAQSHQSFSIESI